MSDEFQVSLPSVRQLQSLITEKTKVEIKVSTGDLLIGKIIWHDTNCLCMQDHDGQSVIIWKQGIVFLKPKA
jgi:host factor-I protein